MDNREVIDLTDRVFLLRDHLERGIIQIAPHLIGQFRESFEQIAIDENGLVVPESVDGRIRALTLGLKYFRYREESKKSISLMDIQSKYFEVLTINFGEIYEMMIEGDGDPNSMAHFLSEKADFVEHFSANIGELVSGLTEFWKAAGEAAYFHVEDSQSLKAVFGGDLFPSYERNIASSAGLYVDTIVLPCPITHAAKLLDYWKPEKAVYYIVKHALNALAYRDLALADVTPPIVVILPDIELLEPDHVDMIRHHAESAATRHASSLFGGNFESIEEVSEFLGPLSEPTAIIEKIRDPKLFLFDSALDRDPTIQFESVLKDLRRNFGDAGWPVQPNQLVSSQLIGRMMQAASVELKSSRLSGTPLLDADTSWQYLNWKMRHDAVKSGETGHPSEEMHIVHALQSEQERGLAWLGNVPKSSIIEIRRNGHAEEMRKMLSDGIAELVQANPAEFFRTSGKVVENLDIAFLEHQRVLEEAKKMGLRAFGLDVGSCLTVGGISVAAAITGNIGLGATAAILGVAGFPTLKDLKTDYKTWKAAKEKIESSPTALLFRHLK